MANYTQELSSINLHLSSIVYRLVTIENKLNKVISSNSCIPGAQHEMYVDTIKALRDMNQGAYSLLHYDEQRTLRELREARED